MAGLRLSPRVRLRQRRPKQKVRRVRGQGPQGWCLKKSVVQVLSSLCACHSWLGWGGGGVQQSSASFMADPTNEEACVPDHGRTPREMSSEQDFC